MNHTFHSLKGHWVKLSHCSCTKETLSHVSHVQVIQDCQGWHNLSSHWLRCAEVSARRFPNFSSSSALECANRVECCQIFFSTHVLMFLLSQSPEPWSLQTEKEPLVVSQMSEISRPWSQASFLHWSFAWCEVLRQQRGQPHWICDKSPHVEDTAG